LFRFKRCLKDIERRSGLAGITIQWRRRLVIEKGWLLRFQWIGWQGNARCRPSSGKAIFPDPSGGFSKGAGVHLPYQWACFQLASANSSLKGDAVSAQRALLVCIEEVVTRRVGLAGLTGPPVDSLGAHPCARCIIGLRGAGVHLP